MSDDKNLNTNTNTEPTNIDDKNNQNQTVPKSQFDKLMSEVAELKKANRNLMSDEEKRKADELEKDKTIAELQKQVTKANLTSKLTSVYGNEVAIKIADAIASGNSEELANLLVNHMTGINTTHQTELNDLKLQLTAKPDTDGQTQSNELTNDDFKKMTLDERMQLKINNFALYEKIKN